MGLFRKSDRSNPTISKDANLQAMVVTASHICDASIKDNKLTGKLTDLDWELIWSSILFGGLRFMENPESIEFTNDFIKHSNIDIKLRKIHEKVSTAPDERVFYSFNSDHQRWLNEVNKQIYEIAFEEGLTRHTNVNRSYIFDQIHPMVEHYVVRNANPLKDVHLAFSQIVASSIALAAEEIISQEKDYGLRATKDRYGACQVLFSLAIFLFNQRV